MSDLRSGKWVCEEKGIPTDKLISACNSCKITAYSPDDGRKILASSQCRKKFLFHDKLYFSFLTKKYPDYIAINKDDLNHFNIYLGKQLYNLYKYDGNTSEGTLSLNKEVVLSPHPSISGYHALHEFQYGNNRYLFFFKSKCDISKLSDIYRSINYLYRASELILEPKREGRFTFRLLELDPHNQRQIPREVKFSIKKIEYEGTGKLILEDYNNDISIYHNGFQCIDCTVSPLRNNKENRQFFSEDYQKCRRYFHQYKLDYFRPDNREFKKPLQLKTDFFTFDYKEYCQQAFLQENEESKSDFYGYVKSLFFDINEIRNIFVDGLGDYEVKNDPLLNIKNKCLLLLEKYDGCEEEKIIRAYLRAITSDEPYYQLHDKFFPHRKKVNKKGQELDNSNKEVYFCKFLCKFKSIAEENGLKFIPVRDFRRIGELEVREKVQKSLKEKP